MMMECAYCRHKDITCSVGAGYCHCGCGERTEPRKNSRPIPGVDKGSPTEFLPGHWNRNRIKIAPEEVARLDAAAQRYIDEGVCPHCGEGCPHAGQCHCGCGQEMDVVPHSNYTLGIARGMPYYRKRGHHARVLNEEVVREIRYLYATESNLTQRELSEKFGVSQVTISRIVLFDIWKNAGIKSTDHD